MSPVEFNKTLCRLVEFKGQGPQRMKVDVSELEGDMISDER